MLSSSIVAVVASLAFSFPILSAVSAEPRGADGLEVLAQGRPTETVMVIARQFDFEPAYPSVPAGTRVAWVNRDREAHTVTSDVGLFNAEIGPGERFTFTFDEPGAYFFYCLPHDWMIGEVTVDPVTEVPITEVMEAAGEPADIARHPIDT